LVYLYFFWYDFIGRNKTTAKLNPAFERKFDHYFKNITRQYFRLLSLSNQYL